ncbi:MAG: TniQ family protein [Phormidium tanganyikae FI6-MK23]|nr:TniQ family protein [Phormidium tanganyikae FI6-MK23]
MAGLGGVLISRWEKFRLNPYPADEELAKLGKLIGLQVNELKPLFPAPGQALIRGTVRLCAACYNEAAFHRLHWQFKSVAGCEQHCLRLLSKCPHCGTSFPLPSDWAEGKCRSCGTRFGRMSKHQKSY